MKECSKCKQSKPLSDFPKSGGKGDLSSWCRACHHARYLANKQKLAAQNLEAAAFDPLAELEKAKDNKGATAREIALAIGVHEATVCKWFRRSGMPRQKHLKAMYEYLQVPLPLILQAGENGRLPLAVADCANCGKPFPVYKAGVKHCSAECSGKTLSQRQTGRNNAMWKGGQYVVNKAGNGYIKQLSPDHPNADGSGYVLQHRLVMEQRLGRKLERHERVHHKNGNRQDNRPENLELWQAVGQSQKDPCGVRAVDAVCDRLSDLTVDELRKVMSVAQLLIEKRNE